MRMEATILKEMLLIVPASTSFFKELFTYLLPEWVGQ